MARDKYEISIWEDYLVAASGNVPEHYEERKLGVIGSDSITATCTAYEPKLVSNINGTNTFTFKMFYVCRDNDLESVKGYLITTEGYTIKDENSLYIAWESVLSTGDTYRNPFLSLLVNERKIKVLWQDQWYDFVIKNIQEDSTGKSIVYTCKDLHVNELSKTGYNLEFDAELKNNQGTAEELGARIINDTTWKVIDENGHPLKVVVADETTPAFSSSVSYIVGDVVKYSSKYYRCIHNTGPGDWVNANWTITYNNEVYPDESITVEDTTIWSDVIQQEKEEPLYIGNVTTTFTAINETNNSTVTIPRGSTIYVFYSCVQDQETYCQLLYSPTNIYKTDVNSQLIIDLPCLGVNGVVWTDSTYTNIFTVGEISSNYRGSRLVRQQKKVFDSLTERNVDVYVANGTYDDYNIYGGDLIYGYTDTQVKDAIYVNNLFVNSKNFADGHGWTNYTNSSQPGEEYIYKLYPSYSGIESWSGYNPKSYLRLNKGFNLNDGLKESINFLPEGITKGQKFVFRCKVKNNNNGVPGDSYVFSNTIDFDMVVVNSNMEPLYSVGSLYSRTQVEDWIEITVIFTRSFTKEQIANYVDDRYNLKLYVCILNFSGEYYWLEEAEFFPLIYDKNGIRINPGEMAHEALVTTRYNYYNHYNQGNITSADDMLYLYRDLTQWNYITEGWISPVYNDSFEKIRSITGKQSNRFNLLQSVSETFECWCKFTIVHDTTGKIIYDDGVPRKYISFKRDIGQKTGIGFIYGIDLKSITRTIQSDQIVTKTIVNQNNNEFAKNGFCTIARSPENYARDNFILNFDYYISQGLLENGQVQKDLYTEFNGVNKGYYGQLHDLNIIYENNLEFISLKEIELTKQQSYKKVYENYLTALREEKDSIQVTIMKYANVNTWADACNYVSANPDWLEIQTQMVAWANCNHNITEYTSMLTGIASTIASIESDLETKKAEQITIINNLKTLNYAFYKKYANYIQEGSWISEEYIDDTLYYFDALGIAYTSARPQISYNISVARLSSLEEYKNKVFRLGDVGFVQDTEFFGYVYINNIKTPYKEKILISEVTFNFRAPEQDTFKVQNYKTQFEDLFQRITASTQSLQYASGEYARAANVVETTGVIDQDVLQNSIDVNYNLVQQANNEQIYQDNTGITVSDATNPNKKTKITSGGIFITTDAGQTWKNAVRGEGIATQYLTAGSINTNQIALVDGQFQTFRWDSSGINAYYGIVDPNTGKLSGISLNKFVRFDHFGVYGVQGPSGTTYSPLTEDSVWDTAAFGMTWKGFFMKTKDPMGGAATGLIEVSSENDIQVKDSSGYARVKIGRIDGSGTDLDPYKYGIAIRDRNNNPVMITHSDGTLWLENKLIVGAASNQSPTVSIGYDPSNVRAGTSYHEVIHAGTGENGTGHEFIVWEDGSITATNGYFSGEVQATSGTFSGTIHASDGDFSGAINATSGTISGNVTIGGLTVGTITDAAYKTVITSSAGTIFKSSEGKITDTILTATLYRGASPVTSGTFTYQWYEDGSPISEATSQTYRVQNKSTGNDGTINYDCNIGYTPPIS